MVRNHKALVKEDPNAGKITNKQRTSPKEQAIPQLSQSMPMVNRKKKKCNAYV